MRLIVKQEKPCAENRSGLFDYWTGRTPFFAKTARVRRSPAGNAGVSPANGIPCDPDGRAPSSRQDACVPFPEAGHFGCIIQLSKEQFNFRVGIARPTFCRSYPAVSYGHIQYSANASKSCKSTLPSSTRSALPQSSGCVQFSLSQFAHNWAKSSKFTS